MTTSADSSHLNREGLDDHGLSLDSEMSVSAAACVVYTVSSLGASQFEVRPTRNIMGGWQAGYNSTLSLRRASCRVGSAWMYFAGPCMGRLARGVGD